MNDRLRSLQYLRAVAALLVVAYHTSWTRSFVGEAGADIFFVVSGFVMALVGWRAASPGQFLIARLLRIAPLYWLVTLIWYAQGVAAGGTDEPDKLLASMLFLPYARFPTLYPGWTLNYEAFFYALFALCLLAPSRVRLLALGGILLAAVGAGAVLDPAKNPLRTWTDPVVLEFLAGAWLCRAWRAGWLPSGALAWAAIAMAALVLPATHLIGEQHAAAWRALVWGVPATVLVAGAVGLEAGGALPRVPLLGAIGDSSYSLYLTHVPLLVLITGPLLPLPTPIGLPAALALCTAAGYATYMLVERPLGRLAQAVRRRMGGDRPTPAALVPGLQRREPAARTR